jgi:hypothetical protein
MMKACKYLQFAGLAVLIALASCATYAPPAPVSQEAFSRSLNASYDRTWSAVTYVAGASFFHIKAFEKASGLMTLDFELKDVTTYVDCGSAVMGSAQRPALLALGLTAFSLEGTANINIRSEGPRQTAIQFNSQYTLAGYGPAADGTLQKLVEWQFTSRTSDTEMRGVNVTCRPSYRIERDFLNEVAARL